MQQMDILLVILFLSRKKFHAEQIFVLSSSMKLAPGLSLGAPSKVYHSFSDFPIEVSFSTWNLPCPLKDEIRDLGPIS